MEEEQHYIILRVEFDTTKEDVAEALNTAEFSFFKI